VSSDLTVDLVQTRIAELDDVDPAALGAQFEELEARGRSELGSPGSPPRAHDQAETGRFEVTRSADLRFRGQAHQLTVPVPMGAFGTEDLSVLAKRFHEVYRQTYGIDADAPVQLVNTRVRVVRIVEKPAPRPLPVTANDARSALVGERQSSFVEAGGFVTTPVFAWQRCAPGLRLVGPAIVEGPDATIVVPPAHTATVDEWRNVVLELPEEPVVR
jgi:N-methylhydantoinase A